MTFAAAWILSSQTMTLDAASQTGAFSLVSSTTNLGAGMARSHFFRLIQVLFTASRYSHPCSMSSWGTHIGPSNWTQLYGASLIRKISTVALACTFTRSFTNRKRLVYGCRVNGSSPYANHYS
ncbi:hypothetical protein TNCV_1466921 [Trichonephila clavipes]|nr:hypothetical protein TNCV_1466921 [Trichonephila clavipes]